MTDRERPQIEQTMLAVAKTRKVFRDGDEKGDGKDPVAAQQLLDAFLAACKGTQGEKDARAIDVTSKRATVVKNSDHDKALALLEVALTVPARAAEQVGGAESAEVKRG